MFFTTTEQPFEQLVACSTDEDSATRGAFAKGNKRLVNGSYPKGGRVNKEKKLEIMVHPKVKNGKYVDWVDFGLYNNLDDYSILKDVQND